VQGVRQVNRDLTERIRSGDSSAIEQAYDELFTPVLNFVYYMIYDYHSASDISQDAFLRTVDASRDRKKDVRDFKSYLFGTARNLAVDHLNKAKKLARSMEDALSYEDPEIFSDPGRAALLAEQRTTVRKAVERLNEHQRVALTLRDIDGWSYNDIAEVMGMSRTAVGVLLSRARLKFKKEFRLQEIDSSGLAPRCLDMVPMMSAVLDNEATDDEKRAVQEHLRTCPGCRERMDEMAGASTVMRSMVPVIPAMALRAALVAKAAAAGAATGAAAAAVGAGMSAATKAIIAIVATVLVAGAGVGTFVGIKVTSNVPAPGARIVRPLDGVSLSVSAGPGGAGTVTMTMSVDNRPTAVELEVDGKLVKRFERGPYSFDWVTTAVGTHTARPTAFDSSGKAYPGTAVTFTLSIAARVAQKVVFLQDGAISSCEVDGSGMHNINTTGKVGSFATSSASGQIAYVNDSNVMYLINENGTGNSQVTLPEKGKVFCAGFSRDDRFIYFTRATNQDYATAYPNGGDYPLRFERYDIAANKVDLIYTRPAMWIDGSIGDMFTVPAGDYLYYNLFGSDFPSSQVFRITLGGNPSEEPYMPRQTDVPGTRVVCHMLESISADGTLIAYQRQAVLAGQGENSSTQVSTCLRGISGGEPTVLETVDISTWDSGRTSDVEFSTIDPRTYYSTHETRSSTGGSTHIVMYSSTVGGQPVPTGLSGSNWDAWHVIGVPRS
jgi:RNA polymerase sigma-70 factor, ECF subfamily